MGDAALFRRQVIFDEVGSAMVGLVAGACVTCLLLGRAKRKAVPPPQFDPLTGLYHRNVLFSMAASLIAQAKAEGGVLGIVLIDIDGMYSFNSGNGHPSGDRLIIDLARMVQSHLPEGAVAARIGGDEFLVAVPAKTEAEVAAFAETVRRSAKEVRVAREPVDGKYGDAAPVTMTLGLAFSPRQGDDWQDLLRAADEALHQGKQVGGDSVV